MTVYPSLATPLCLQLLDSNLAVFPHRDVAAILLEHEKWEEMLRSSDEESTTPMRGLIAFMPGRVITVSITFSQNTLVVHSTACSVLKWG